MMLLRRKIINMMKPKTLNGKLLNGEMLLNLAENYVAAINKGAVPNIENAWTYICKNECLKAFHSALDKYDGTMKELLYERLPMDSAELKEAHQEAYELALAEFNRISVGANTQEYMKDLTAKIKQKYTTLKVENEREAKKCIQGFLGSAYMSIEQKIRNNEFPTFEEYLRELKAFQMYFMENGPPGPNRKALLLEYCQKVQAEVAELFSKKLSAELDLQKTLTHDTVQKLESQIMELKEEHKTEADSMAGKIRLLETEKAELSAKEQGLRENCNTIMKEKAAREREMAEQLDEVKKEAERNMRLLRDKISQHEEQVRAAQEKAITTESDSNKQQALLEQKISYLEKTLEEARAKEKEYAAELRNTKKDHLGITKEITAKYEAQLKDLQQKLDTFKEQTSELEAKMAEMQQTYENEKLQWIEDMESANSKREDSGKLVADLKAQLENKNEKIKSEQKALEEKFAKERADYQAKIAELQATNKSLDEQMKASKIKWEKEEAINKQKQEFYEVQLSEAKKQLEETRKSHETMVRALENKEKDVICQEEASKQLIMMKDEHLNEIREIEETHEEVRKRLAAQLEQVSEKANDLELKLKLQQTDYEKDLEGKNEYITTLQSQLDKAAQQIKASEAQKVKLLEETEKNYKEIIEGLETQLEEKAKKQQADLQEVQRRSEESLAQLRNFYEMEKDRLEARIMEEKEKAQRICAQQVEECEMRLKDEQQQRAEEIEALQNELAECAAQNRDIIAQLEQEAELHKQKIKALEEQIKEFKDQFARFQTMNTTALEQQMNNFAEERKGMIEKIERLSHEITVKERQITTLENKNESIKQDLERNSKTAEEWKMEKIAEKNALTEKVEALKAKNQQISDDFMQKKLESSRESALLKQQAEFLNNKIKELQATIEDITKRYEEKLQLMKQENSQQLKDTIDRLSKDKEQYEQKYEQKRKALKELESNITKQTNKLEKEKIALTEKYNTLETRNAELEKQYQEETKSLQSQIAQLKDSLAKDRSSTLLENEKLKKQLMELDRDLCEVQANYDKDKELWADRFHFLEQQRDQSKSDLMEAQKKFELTLEQLQKRGSIDKDKSETNQMALITSLEQKHKYQIKELNESHQHVCNELMQKTKQLEKELKVVSEKLQFEQRAKQAEATAFEKKIAESLEALNKVSKELEEIKADRDRRVLEYQKLFEKERENYKSKLQEIENKYTEVDSKRGVMMMDFEKERAKWSLERDHLIMQKNEAHEIIARLEKRKENLMLENDKLKSERTMRKPLYAGVANSTTSMSRYTSIASGKYKENYAGMKPMTFEDKGYIHDIGDTDSSHSSKSRGPSKSTRLFAPKGGDEESKQQFVMIIHQSQQLLYALCYTWVVYKVINKTNVKSWIAVVSASNHERPVHYLRRGYQSILQQSYSLYLSATRTKQIGPCQSNSIPVCTLPSPNVLAHKTSVFPSPQGTDQYLCQKRQNMRL
eukprot:TRINITY_DN722_c0_g1_i1.p1 TRINITY_DN722_c0_g1~~TRINITY_DN722_c0_g1_i1.p1  ORF type:complete len:1467 (-),score=323.46 TRINITY_DN722_c0_g1_i1:3360-7760(-)